jgi:hypothetical protein
MFFLFGGVVGSLGALACDKAETPTWSLIWSPICCPNDRLLSLASLPIQLSIATRSFMVTRAVSQRLSATKMSIDEDEWAPGTLLIDILGINAHNVPYPSDFVVNLPHQRDDVPPAHDCSWCHWDTLDSSQLSTDPRSGKTSLDLDPTYVRSPNLYTDCDLSQGMDGPVERKSSRECDSLRALEEFPLTVVLTSMPDIINQLQEIIQLFHREQDEERRELVAECARVQVVLENINNTRRRIATVESVHCESRTCSLAEIIRVDFVTEINCIANPAAPSTASVLRLLNCIGMNHGWRNLHGWKIEGSIFPPASTLEHNAYKLGQDIVERV